MVKQKSNTSCQSRLRSRLLSTVYTHRLSKRNEKLTIFSGRTLIRSSLPSLQTCQPNKNFSLAHPRSWIGSQVSMGRSNFQPLSNKWCLLLLLSTSRSWIRRQVRWMILLRTSRPQPLSQILLADQPPLRGFRTLCQPRLACTQRHSSRTTMVPAGMEPPRLSTSSSRPPNYLKSVPSKNRGTVLWKRLQILSTTWPCLIGLASSKINHI